MRRLDLGISSFGSPDLLRRTLDSVMEMSVCDWRVLVVDNPHPETGYAAKNLALGRNPRIEVRYSPANLGYAGAVNEILSWAQTEYIAYLDHDVAIRTLGWDEAMCSLLDRRHEVGMVFGNGGAYPIDRGEYHEVMWSPGFAWVLARMCMADVGRFDTEISHQNEADYALRVRMAGWKCAALPQVRIDHLAKETNNPESIARIANGVREWVDKWNHALCGKNIGYHSTNVLRWHDWHCNALYLEEYFKLRVPDLNKEPETITIDGTEYDLIKVLRLKGFYNSRII